MKTVTYSEIKKQLNINIDKHLNNGFASLTHYWQNFGSNIADYYKEPALQYLKDSLLKESKTDLAKVMIPQK
jgi:DNA (cytosine-5)-methyltransferase 1